MPHFYQSHPRKGDHVIQTIDGRTIHLFYGYVSPFSNFYRCRILMEGRLFSCSEQAYCLAKARFFSDKRTQQAVMAASAPSRMKALGKSIRRFDPILWDRVSPAQMKRILHRKYTNPRLRAKLLSTGDAYLAEASPWDSRWGIGTDMDDPAIRFGIWPGENILGELLMQVRDELKKKKRNSNPPGGNLGF